MTGITGIIAFIELVWIAMTSLKMLDWFTVIFAMVVKLKLLFYTGAKRLLHQVIHWFSKSNNKQF